MRTELEPKDEAAWLLKLYDNSLSSCVSMVQDQLNVIQARSQFLLTLGTLTLTITGFSGPKIAETNAFSRYSIAMGIALVLCSIMMMLLATNRIRWVTRVGLEDPELILVTILGYRNKKTRFYQIELYLLVIGLAFYVASVISFLIFFKT